MSSKGKLTVLTGPSGVGKGTIVKIILHKYNDVWLSISATTRPPRKGEIHGKDYSFLKPERFVEILSIAANIFGENSNKGEAKKRNILLGIGIK